MRRDVDSQFLVDVKHAVEAIPDMELNFHSPNYKGELMVCIESRGGDLSYTKAAVQVLNSRHHFIAITAIEHLASGAANLFILFNGKKYIDPSAYFMFHCVRFEGDIAMAKNRNISRATDHQSNACKVWDDVIFDTLISALDVKRQKAYLNNQDVFVSAQELFDILKWKGQDVEMYNWHPIKSADSVRNPLAQK